jgi:hypothetical protein
MHAPPAPLTETVPVGVPAAPLTSALAWTGFRTVVDPGETLTVTVGLTFVTDSVVVPLEAGYVPFPP